LHNYPCSGKFGDPLRLKISPGLPGSDRCLQAAAEFFQLLDTLGVELPEPKVELPLGLLGVAAGLVAYTGDDVDEAAAKAAGAEGVIRPAKNACQVVIKGDVQAVYDALRKQL
jgi:hypothetical protein